MSDMPTKKKKDFNKKPQENFDKNLTQVQTGNIDLLTIQLLDQINQNICKILTELSNKK